jgi:glycosyltransferase involved in cell wall biosynthesis
VIPETFDFREYDLVISSSGAWSKGIVTRLDTIHISYLHSPLRFVWDYSDKYTKEIKESKLAFFIRFVLSYVRIWDNLAAQRPDYLISNSQYTQRRVRKYYQRESEIIYPSVINELPGIIENNEKKFFLVVSRLSPYKKVDLVVEAFNKLGLPLVVIGEGSQEKYLRKIANENIKILGWKDDESVKKYYANARGFIFPAEDDFGITAVEAMSYGTPVIAFKQGGVCETVIEGVTGEFFVSQTAEVLADGVRRFMQNENNYDKELIRKRAMEFSRERFEREFKTYVDSILGLQNE